jgi:hypothetical protein
MSSNKRIWFNLFLVLMVSGAILNVVYAINEELYKTLQVYQRWFLIIFAVLFMANEIRVWNKPVVHSKNEEGSSVVNPVSLRRQKFIAFTGLGVSLIGFLLLVTLDSRLPGSLITSSGLLIMSYGLYMANKT